MNRLPTILILAAILLGLVVFGDPTDEAPQVGTGSAGPDDPTPLTVALAPAATGAGSTWYCPAGFTTPDEANDHRLVILNDQAEPVRGQITVYPSLVDTLGNPVSFDRAVQPVEVAAHSVETISLAPLVASLNPLLGTETGSFVGALVELAGPGVRVEHTLETPTGSARSVCATSASPTWYFASGTTIADVTYQLYLLNPFPDDAVVDIRFVTDGGVRTPTSVTGRLVPAQSLTMIDLSPIVTVWPQIAAEITTRTGRVVAERVQLFRGSDGPTGVSLTPGTPKLADQWFFPGAGTGVGAGESYVIYNPNDESAEVEFELKPDSADRAGDIALLPFVIGPDERWVVNVDLHPHHPSETVATIDATTLARTGERYFVSVRSFNDVPIATERLWTRAGDVGVGVSQSFGIAAASTDQVVMVPTAVSQAMLADPEARVGELAVLNPAGITFARVEVWVGGGGEPALLRRSVELAPRRRAAFFLDTLLDADDEWVRISSSTGTMVELVAALPDSLTSTRAVPLTGTVSTPPLTAID